MPKKAYDYDEQNNTDMMQDDDGYGLEEEEDDEKDEGDETDEIDNDEKEDGDEDLE